MKRRKQSEQGFILLEILILLILVGLFLAATGPMLVAKMQEGHEDNAAEGVKRVVAAEVVYQAKYQIGYATDQNTRYLSTCNHLQQGNYTQGCLVSPLLTQRGIAYNGYLFSTTVPAEGTGFLVVASPMNQFAGRKVYCGGSNDGLLHSTVGWNTPVTSLQTCNGLPYAEDTDQGPAGQPCDPSLNAQCQGPMGAPGPAGGDGKGSTIYYNNQTYYCNTPSSSSGCTPPSTTIDLNQWSVYAPLSNSGGNGAQTVQIPPTNLCCWLDPFGNGVSYGNRSQDGGNFQAPNISLPPLSVAAGKYIVLASLSLTTGNNISRPSVSCSLTDTAGLISINTTGNVVTNSVGVIVPLYLSATITASTSDTINLICVGTQYTQTGSGATTAVAGLINSSTLTAMPAQ